MKHYCLLALTLLLFSCSSGEFDSPDESTQEKVQSLGAYEEDCKWIYSQMNHDYLWREDMPDSLSCNYGSDPVTFYKFLLSSKDRFSYCEHNTSYSGISERQNRGFEYQEYKNDLGEKFNQVLYVLDKNLKKEGLNRGDIIRLYGNQIIKGELLDGRFQSIDTLEASSLLSRESTVYLDTIYSIAAKKIGYLCYLQFDDISELIPVFKKFYDNNIDELILDLRYNPGGYVNTCKYLTNSIISEDGYSGIFQQCTYNDVITKELIEETGSGVTINKYTKPNNGSTLPGAEMYGLNLKRVFVLTSKYSASASEAAIISMRPFMDVIIIGEQTYGKGVGSWTIKDDQYKYQLQPITMRYHNALMETTPDDGIPVTYYVPDGYSTSKKELGDIEEPLLAKALECIGVVPNTRQAKANNAPSYNADKIEAYPVGAPSFFILK